MNLIPATRVMIIGFWDYDSRYRSTLTAKYTNRRFSQTPLEFLPSLQGLFPASMVELDTITEAYLRVRYGELPETASEVEYVERAWRLIQVEGQTKLRKKRVIGQ